MGAKRMSPGERVTAFAAGAAVALRPVIRFVRPDLGSSLAARLESERSLGEWANTRTPGPLVWLHGASAGELLGAVPAIAALRERRDVSLLVTHFSPSGVMALERLHPDFATLLPLDRAGTWKTLMELLRPDLLLFAKLDVWPGLVRAAGDAGVPRTLINAVVRSGSGRLRWPARTLFRDSYGSLESVGAASEKDAARLLRLGVSPASLHVTGDSSFDLARSRAAEAREPGGLSERLEGLLPRRPDDGRRLVAGSTWALDEAALLDAIEALPATAGGRFGWQPVLAPHKPSVTHVRRLIGECRRRGHPVARWSDGGSVRDLPAHGIVVFDEMGVLAELYTVADVAYVGGGLGTDGLHNVLEPAAAGIPVLFGPRNDRGDAAGLVAAGGGFECEGPALGGRLQALVDVQTREAAGRAAGNFVEAGCGAASATADLLEPLLGPLEA